MNSVLKFLKKRIKGAANRFSDTEIEEALRTSGLINNRVPDEVRKLLANYFDDFFYRINNPDVEETGVDPLQHYLAYGWKEGRNPSPTFNTLAYMPSQPESTRSEQNPLIHYAMTNSTRKKTTVRDLVAEYFDEKYYLMINSDVAEAKVNALEHYLKSGCKEGRNPNHTFNTTFYLEQNIDVADSGVNPLLHYAKSGRDEKRLTQHPIRAEIRAIMNLSHANPPPVYNKSQAETLETNSNTASIPGTKETGQNIEPILKEAINNSNRQLVISISHDIYTEHCGGIQSFISDEQAKFNKKDISYLHISPADPSQGLSFISSREFQINVVSNGNLHDPLSFHAFQEALLSALTQHPDLEILIIIHSLLGHNISLINKLHKAINNPSTSLFWLHDYFSLCPSYTLLRNGIEFCAAPRLESAGCRICGFLEKRHQLFYQMQQMFDSIPFHIVAPSQTALDLWLSRAQYPFESAFVHPHLTMSFTDKAKTINKSNTDKPLKACYAGYPVIHKGWLVFQNLLDSVDSSEDFTFHHLSTEPSSDYRPSYCEARATKDSPDAMIKTLEAEDIDLVIIPAIWPESFCYVAYEALAAGCIVVTLKSSGNVATLAGEVEQVISYKDEKALIRAFEDGSLKATAEKMLADGISVPELHYQGTSATLDLKSKELAK